MQLIWASTYRVGCGVKRCQEMEGEWNEDEDDDDDDDDEYQNVLYMVCNYGPGYVNVIF